MDSKDQNQMQLDALFLDWISYDKDNNVWEAKPLPKPTKIGQEYLEKCLTTRILHSRAKGKVQEVRFEA